MVKESGKRLQSLDAVHNRYSSTKPMELEDLHEQLHSISRQSGLSAPFLSEYKLKVEDLSPTVVSIYSFLMIHVTNRT